MKLLTGGTVPIVELTRRNIEVLLAKLGDPESQRTLVLTEDGREVCAVRAVENDEHYADREPGIMFLNGQFL